MEQPQTVTVKSTSPMADMQRKQCMDAVNNLSDTQLNNFSKLIKSEKALAMIGNNLKFQMLKSFI